MFDVYSEFGYFDSGLCWLFWFSGFGLWFLFLLISEFAGFHCDESSDRPNSV